MPTLTSHKSDLRSSAAPAPDPLVLAAKLSRTAALYAHACKNWMATGQEQLVRKSGKPLDEGARLLLADIFHHARKEAVGRRRNVPGDYRTDPRGRITGD